MALLTNSFDGVNCEVDANCDFAIRERTIVATFVATFVAQKENQCSLLLRNSDPLLAPNLLKEFVTIQVSDPFARESASFFGDRSISVSV